MTSFKESLQILKLISLIIISLFVLIVVLLIILLLVDKLMLIVNPFSHSIIGTKPLFAIIELNFFFLLKGIFVFAFFFSLVLKKYKLF